MAKKKLVFSNYAKRSASTIEKSLNIHNENNITLVMTVMRYTRKIARYLKPGSFMSDASISGNTRFSYLTVRTGSTQAQTQTQVQAQGSTLFLVLGHALVLASLDFTDVILLSLRIWGNSEWR